MGYDEKKHVETQQEAQRRQIQAENRRELIMRRVTIVLVLVASAILAAVLVTIVALVMR